MNISATKVTFDEHSMWVGLSDGRTIGVPFAWFPRLLNAKPSQREKVEIGRHGLHWDEIDEDISIAGLLAGRRDQTVNVARAKGGRRRPSRASFASWGKENRSERGSLVRGASTGGRLCGSAAEFRAGERGASNSSGSHCEGA
jgi:Protein of unknown function (DUF2442)